MSTKAPADGHYTMPGTRVRFRARKGAALPPDATFVGVDDPAEKPEKPATPAEKKARTPGPAETTEAAGPAEKE